MKKIKYTVLGVALIAFLLLLYPKITAITDILAANNLIRQTINQFKEPTIEEFVSRVMVYESLSEVVDTLDYLADKCGINRTYLQITETESMLDVIEVRINSTYLGSRKGFYSYLQDLQEISLIESFTIRSETESTMQIELLFLVKM